MRPLALLWLALALPLAAQTAPAASTPDRVTLPPGIVWETDLDEPLIGSPDAIRGGEWNDWMSSYPLTFRVVGPNSNDAFAAWSRISTLDMVLVIMHPTTDRFIPRMATHWSVQPDQRTIYFKLDPDARWSDGEPVTADDYVFTLEMLRSPHIVDPYYNSYAEQYYESVDRIDDYTIRVVGKQPSWRPLYDYGPLWPTPRHATVLDEGWVERTNNEQLVVAGPYVVSEVSRGESVTFTRVPDWWGDDKRYFRGLYNFDRMVVKVVPIERVLDYLRQGQIDMAQEYSARVWNESYGFDAVRNGWIKRARVFVDIPQGISGLHMNLEAPIFQNKDFRKAMQYLFNFERLNRNLMFDEYFRQVSFFDGTQYANPDLEPYPFDPVKAREHLERAGYHRPDAIRGTGFLAAARRTLRGLIMTRTEDDDILVNDRGEKASFTLIYGQKTLERHLVVMQQEFRRAGVEVKLRLLEPGAAFERGIERKYEMINTNRTSTFFPAVRQYLHSEFKASTNNNNIWGYATPLADSLIEVYEKDLDFEKRRDALWRLDEIVQDEAFYLPWWKAPFIRLAYWDYVRFPDFWLPKRTNTWTDWLVYWIDPERKAALQEAMAAGRALELDPDEDKDPYDLIEGP